MNILGIETSCDDTGVALLECRKQKCCILSNVISSQIKIHAPYGGVVPNLASRAHLENIKPCLEKALKEARYPKIDLIAVTKKPGLSPCLLVGINFAKALAYAWQKPLAEINHIKGHLFANWLSLKEKYPLPKLPALCLVASGGHTQLILMKSYQKYQILGETRDDAAGEAFDKAAKMLGLGYPGGPLISARARQGDARKIDLPRPMIKENNFDFSFSGLKTAVFYKVREKKNLSQKYINDMSAAFQQAIIDVLISKTIKAGKKHLPKSIMLSGGVSANQELRQQMRKAVKDSLPQARFYLPQKELCTDNGAMIAAAAYYQKKKGARL